MCAAVLLCFRNAHIGDLFGASSKPESPRSAVRGRKIPSRVRKSAAAEFFLTGTQKRRRCFHSGGDLFHFERKRARKSRVFGSDGFSKISFGAPSSQISPSAINTTFVETSRANAIS